MRASQNHCKLFRTAGPTTAPSEHTSSSSKSPENTHAYTVEPMQEAWDAVVLRSYASLQIVFILPAKKDVNNCSTADFLTTAFAHALVHSCISGIVGLEHVFVTALLTQVSLNGRTDIYIYIRDILHQKFIPSFVGSSPFGSVRSVVLPATRTHR